MRRPPRPCANCGGDINILAALAGKPRPHANQKYCTVRCREAAERRRANRKRLGT